MTAEDSLRKFLSAVREGIRKQMQERDLNASGETSASLQIVSTPEPPEAKLVGPDSMYFIINGRRPGTVPPIMAIEEWIKHKGLDLNPFAVAANMAKEGTTIYRRERKGLQILPIMMEFKEELMRDLALAKGQEIINRMFGRE